MRRTADAMGGMMPTDLDRIESEATPGALLFAYALLMAAMLATQQPVVLHHHRLDRQWIKAEMAKRYVHNSYCAR